MARFGAAVVVTGAEDSERPSIPSAAMRVCAVLHPGRPAPEGADESVAAATLAEGVAAALRTDCEWLWAIERDTVPGPGALDAMRAVLDDPGGLPEPLLLAGKVVGSDGEPDLRSLPYPEMFEKDTTVAACERSLLNLRAARPGSVLVSRRAIDRFGPPRAGLRPPFDMVEWTARMLRDWEDTGYLVTTSVARRDGAPAPQGSLRDRALATLRGPGWTPTEKLWNAYLLALGIATRGEPERAPRA